MIRNTLRLLVVLLKIFAILVGLLLLIFAVKYIHCPVYDFKPGSPFAGSRLYNPYQQMDPGHWRRGNFQIQSRAWGGLTSGRGNSNTAIHNTYKNLGYEIIATSDYQKINRFGEDRPGYLPVYEHGYGMRKIHQVVLGAKKVMWKEYPFFQTIHHKQHILLSLREQAELIYLAHPMLFHSYTEQDFKTLSGYDGIEVLNNSFRSIAHWDTALSVGNYVTILGNDDAHDISNPDEIGFHCTFVNTADLGQEHILNAFRSGNAYGARIWRPEGELMEDKIKRIQVVPMLTRHQLDGDTLLVECDSVARFIRFIGQKGEVLKTEYNTSTSRYLFRPEDTYIRSEIHFDHESALYMNPVCRYDGVRPATIPTPTINQTKTWLQRILGYATLIFLIINAGVLRKKWIIARGPR